MPWGNPSSPHTEGRAARAKLDEARDTAAAALGVEAREIVFCASGTEAINLALLGVARKLPSSRRVVTWQAEHQSVLAAVRQLQLDGHEVAVLPVDAQAGQRLDELPEDFGLISTSLANNEVGTLQPVSDVATLARRRGAIVHLDACQGLQWVTPPLSDVDLASISGHKLGAGRGAVLWVRAEIKTQPLLHGGPQEWGRRAGREDVGAAVAVAAALKACAERREQRSLAVKSLAAELQAALLRLGGRPTGGDPRLPNFATAAFAERRGEDMLLALDLAGVSASSGSACASGSLDPSHVLLAMGRSMNEALGSLRLTLSYETTAADVERAIGVLEAALASNLQSAKSHAASAPVGL